MKRQVIVASVVGITALVGGVLVARSFYHPIDQACAPPRSSPPISDMCTPIYGGQHDADGLPSSPVSASDITKRVAALPRYPGSSASGFQNVSAEQELHFNGRRGYQSAGATITMNVTAKPAEMLKWYRDRMEGQGWKEQPVSYGAPQLTVRHFLRGHRERATLDIYAADYLPKRQLMYDLGYSISPYVCDGRPDCGDTGAPSFGGM